MATKKEKKAPRATGTPSPAIKWFQDQAHDTTNVDLIVERAKAEDYSVSTISIQLGRLRGMGLLPDKEKKEKVSKAEKVPAESRVRAVPKPSQRRKAAAVA